MSVFTYTLPSGSTFRLTAPTGTTQLEADLIFYGQVAAGALVGYSPGQTLTSTKTAVTKFALSRLDRGTAGVDTQAILSIINNIPTSTGVPALINTPLTRPIGQGDLVKVNPGELAPDAIGPLNSSQVQGILAQIANLIDQPANIMSDDKGVGQYGLSCVQLEQAGYVKPGTWQRFIFDPAPLTTVLSSPGIWTGLKGVNSAADFLSNTGLQTNAQTSLLQNGYNGLVSAGVINPATTQAITASVGQVFTQSGLQTLSSLSAATGASLSVPQSVSTALAGTPLASLLSTPLTNVSTIASGAINTLNNATSSLTNISGIASNLANTALGDVSALVTNAGRFGTAATAAWSQLSSGSISTLTSGLTSLASGTLGNLAGSLNSLASGTLSDLSGSLNSLVGDLGSNLTNLTSNLDITGKAGQFAAAFSDPLSSLSNLGNFDLSSVTNLSSLGDLSGLSGSLSNLGGISGLSSLTGSLGSLSSLTNLGGVGSLTSSLSSLGSLSGSLGSLTNLTGSLGSIGDLTSSLGSIGDLTGSLASLGDLSSLASLGDLGGLGAIGGIFGGGGDDLVSGTKVAAGYSNTVNRATLDVAMTKIIGSSKVPTPIFDFPSVNSISLNASADITAAANILQNLKSQGGALLAQVQTASNSISAIAGSSGIGGAITNVTNAFNVASRII
jgi:hypothetical protein